MANKQASIYNVPLVTDLNMDEYDGTIKQFEGFNKNNSPYVGKCLSNLYKKEVASAGNTVVDADGNLISYDPETKYFKKNGQNWLYNTFEDTQVLVKKEAKFWNEYTGDVIPSGEVVAAIPYDDENVYDYIMWDGEKVYFCYWYEEDGVIKHGIKAVQSNNTKKTLSSCCYRYENIVIFVYGATCACFNNGIEKWSIDSSVNNKFFPRIESVIGRDNRRFFYVFVGTPTACIYKVTQSERGVATTAQFSLIELDYTGSYSYTYGMIAAASDKRNLSQQGPSSDPVSVQNQYAGFMMNEGYLYGGGVLWCGYDSTSSKWYYKTKLDLSSLKPDTYTSTAWSYSNTGVANWCFVINGWSTRVIPTKTIQEDINNYAVIENWYKDVAHTEYQIFPFGIWATTEDYSEDAKGLAFTNDNFPYKKDMNKFSLLYNDKVLSGVSYKGVLLTEWYSVDTEFKVQESVSKNEVIYKSQKSFFICSLQNVSSDTLNIKIYNEKVFTNLSSGICVNIKNAVIKKAFPDFNGRIPYIKGGSWNNAVSIKVALGINPNYTDGEEDIVSMLPNTLVLNMCRATYININSIVHEPNFFYQKTDFYKGSGSSNAKYWETFDTDWTYEQNLSKTDLEWTDDTNNNIVLSPSIFSEFVDTGLNLDLIKEGSDTFKMITYNNKKVYGYYMLSLVENVQNVFVIQGQAYALVDNIIYGYDVEEGVASTSSPILDVRDLKFLAASPYKAYFYSPLARSVFSFTGSNVLNLEFTTTKIKNIVDSKYNPDTLSVIFSTDKELVFVTQFGRFTLDKPAGEQNERLYVTNKGLAVVYPTLGKVVFLRYSKNLPDDQTDFEKQNIELATCFYGVSETQMSINDTLYLRFFDVDTAEGDIEVSAEVITDTGRKTEKTTFHIKPTDWDSVTKSITLRYQPKTQRGLGTSFKVISPFCITSMAVSNTVDNKVTDSVSRSAVITPEAGTNITEW